VFVVCVLFFSDQLRLSVLLSRVSTFLELWNSFLFQSSLWMFLICRVPTLWMSLCLFLFVVFFFGFVTLCVCRETERQRLQAEQQRLAAEQQRLQFEEQKRREALAAEEQRRRAEQEAEERRLHEEMLAEQRRLQEERRLEDAHRLQEVCVCVCVCNFVCVMLSECLFIFCVSLCVFMCLMCLEFLFA
jgi:flagellar biosynthesis component FlhA